VSKKISVTSIFRVLSDQHTQGLIVSIMNTQNPDSDILIAKLHLTKRQFYDRIRDLINSGLIRRERGRYSLSSFGRIIMHLQRMAEKAAEGYWRLEAIDSIRSSANSSFTEVEYTKVVDIFLDDAEIKNAYLYGDKYLQKNPQDVQIRSALRNR
jgi:hypothetical protein